MREKSRALCLEYKGAYTLSGYVQRTTLPGHENALAALLRGWTPPCSRCCAAEPLARCCYGGMLCAGAHEARLCRGARRAPWRALSSHSHPHCSAGSAYRLHPPTPSRCWPPPGPARSRCFARGRPRRCSTPCSKWSRRCSRSWHRCSSSRSRTPSQHRQYSCQPEGAGASMEGAAAANRRRWHPAQKKKSRG